MDWFTAAFIKPFAALTLLDLIKALVAWSAAISALSWIGAACLNTWAHWTKSTHVSARQRAEAKHAAMRKKMGYDDTPLDDQGRPYE